VRAFDPNLLDVLVLDLEVLTLANLVAASNVLLFDHLAGFGVDECCFNLFPVFLLIRLNETRSELDAAG
jgi:hypothetical protein